MIKLGTMMKRCGRYAVAATLLVLSLGCWSEMVWGQGLTGQISGTVTDANGAAVSNATLKVTNTPANVPFVQVLV